MSSKVKGNGKQERVQVVFKVAPAVKTLLQKTAKSLGISMNAAATERIASGRWPKPTKKEEAE